MVCHQFSPQSFSDRSAWKEENRITFSGLYDFETTNYDAPTWGIKYVMHGTEHYFLDKKKFSVSAGRFLLVNRRRPIDILVSSKKKVLALCIHLEHRIMQEVYSDHQRSDGQLLDQPFEKLAIPEVEELLYTCRENALGTYLQTIHSQFDPATGEIMGDKNELFYELAGRILQLQNSLPQKGRGLDVVKSSTKKELLHRLELAVELMNDGESDDMNVLAKKSMLSGSHFFRSFKKVYGVSPYQYLMQKRIRRAADLLATKKMTATEVALSCGFPDIASFSKSFKKLCRQSPSEFIKNSHGGKPVFLSGRV